MSGPIRSLQLLSIPKNSNSSLILLFVRARIAASMVLVSWFITGTAVCRGIPGIPLKTFERVLQGGERRNLGKRLGLQLQSGVSIRGAMFQPSACGRYDVGQDLTLSQKLFLSGRMLV